MKAHGSRVTAPHQVSRDNPGVSPNRTRMTYGVVAGALVLLAACGGADTSGSRASSSGSGPSGTTAGTSPTGSASATPSDTSTPSRSRAPSVSPTATATGSGSPRTTSTPPKSTAPSKKPTTPVITFSDRTVTFERPFSLNPGAKVSPSVALDYRVIRGGTGSYNDEQCRIVKGRLRLADPPRLSAACVVEAYVPDSAGHPPAEPRRALISFDFPRLAVAASSVVVDWSESGPTVRVAVREDSGDAYGMAIWSTDGATERCRPGDVAPGYPSPAGTTEYRLSVSLEDPLGSSYTCNMIAISMPEDIAGGKAYDEFTITVDP